MTPSHSTKNSVPASHVQLKVAQKWKNQTSHPVVNQLVVSQTSHPVANPLVTSQLAINQLVVNQLVTSQLVTSQLEVNHQSSVMTVNGPNAKNPPQLKMVKLNV